MGGMLTGIKVAMLGAMPGKQSSWRNCCGRELRSRPAAYQKYREGRLCLL